MPDKDQRSVLGGLSSSRPERLGAPRNTARATTSGGRRTTVKASAKQRPKAVRAASPPLKTRRTLPPPQPLGAPKGTELVTTTIRAAGELTQIGFTVTGQILKRAVDRIPRP
jgi:hypothetical protein